MSQAAMLLWKPKSKHTEVNRSIASTAASHTRRWVTIQKRHSQTPQTFDARQLKTGHKFKITFWFKDTAHFGLNSFLFWPNNLVPSQLTTTNLFRTNMQTQKKKLIKMQFLPSYTHSEWNQKRFVGFLFQFISSVEKWRSSICFSTSDYFFLLSARKTKPQSQCV